MARAEQLTTAEAYVYERFEEAYTLAPEVLNLYGCSGPALEAYRTGLERYNWLIAGGYPDITQNPKPLREGTRDLNITFVPLIAKAVTHRLDDVIEETGLKCDKEATTNLAITHLAGISAMMLFPAETSFEKPETWDEHTTGSRQFYRSVLDIYPGLSVDIGQDPDEYSDEDMLEYRFGSALANTMFYMRLSNIFDEDGAVKILGTFLESLRPEPQGHPLLTAETEMIVKDITLDYNRQHYEL